MGKRKRKLLLCDDDENYSMKIQNVINTLYPDVYDICIATDQSFDIKVKYDVYFLDIDMPTISGFDIATLIKERYASALIIFLTSHEELSMDGYRYQPWRFISKKRLDAMLPNVLEELKDYFNQFQYVIEVKDENNITTPIYIRDITYLIAKGNYTDINTKHGMYSKRIKMKEFLIQCKSEIFVQIERGIYVNMRYVKSYNAKTGVLLLQDNVQLRVSLIFKKDFLQHYLKRVKYYS